MMRGKTTKSLELACTDAMAGYRVAFLVHAVEFIPHAVRICREDGLLVGGAVNMTRRRIDYPGGGSVEFFVTSQPERMRGIIPDAVYADNHAWAGA